MNAKPHDFEEDTLPKPIDSVLHTACIVSVETLSTLVS